VNAAMLFASSGFPIARERTELPLLTKVGALNIRNTFNIINGMPRTAFFFYI
jgi:hypothetical protein